MTTLNGWPTVPASKVTRIFVGGDRNGATVLAGDVATAFTWLLEQLHAQVEPLTVVNGWRSAADNRRAGGAARSNHISGTAVDVNGGRHPYERHHPGRRYSSGFTTAQAKAVRAILARADGLFRWGLDFPVGLRDAMHFELAGGTTPRDVTAFVATLRTSPDAASAPAATLTTNQEDDMPTLDEIAMAVWGYRNAELERVDAYALLRRTNANAEASARVLRDTKALARAIAAGLPEGSVDERELQRAVKKAVKEALGAPQPA